MPNKPHRQTVTLLLSRGLLISALYLPFAGFAQTAANERELAAINQAISEVQSIIAERSRERDSVYGGLRETEQSLSRISTDINDIREQVTQTGDRLAQLEREQANLRALKARQEELVVQYLNSAYRNGRQEYLKLLLNQEDLAASARTLRYYRYFNEARRDNIDSYTRTLASLAAVAEDIGTTRSTLQSQQRALEAEQSALADARDKRQLLLQDLERILADSGKRLEALEAERVELELLIEELRRSIASLALGDQQQPFEEMRGKLPWPVQGSLQNRFGTRIGLGDLDWRGVTLDAPEGAGVAAIHHGRVIYADWFANQGLLLIVDHGGGYMSLYAHNQLLYKEVGEWVRAGETIASVGNTGGRTDFGLYFEIRHNGQSVNPETWCMARN